MPRAQARVSTAIWEDPDFIALAPGPQRLYLFLLSQPTLQLCGVMPYQPNKWVKKCAGLTSDEIVADLRALEAARFVVCDLDNDELLVRSLMRNDRVTPANSKLWKAALDQVAAVDSPTLRSALDGEIARIIRGYSEDAASELLPETQDAASRKQEAPSRKPGSRTDTPRTRARASALHPPSTNDHPPPSPSGAERFADAYLRHATQQGKVKNPQGLRKWALREWGPWAEERFARAPETTPEHLVDVARALGRPPQQGAAS